MAELGEPRTAEDVLKLRFEFFKHMTTVSTAATVAVVTVYGLGEQALLAASARLDWPDWVILSIPGGAIGGFFLSLLVSLWGLYLAAFAQHTEENAGAIARMLRLSAAAFILGVVISVVMAGLVIHGPRLAAGFALMLAGLVFLFVGFRNA